MPFISSEAMAARWPPHSLASISTSLAMMSSFFWTSPCTFSLPAVPSTSPRAPLLTLMAMRLQARATISMSRRSCGASWASPRCCSIRYWVRLTLWDMMDGFLGSSRRRSVLQRARDDLAHVVGQIGLGHHAAQGFACGGSVGLGQAAPVVQRTGQAGSQLREVEVLHQG